MRRWGIELATALICQGQENEVADTSSPMAALGQLKAEVSKLRLVGRIRLAKVSNPARGTLPENINMDRKTVNDSGYYPF